MAESTLVFDVIDIEGEGTQDKSSIGCYASMGKRLLDVLVISDMEQQLNIKINN
jgi:hypothetical protein